MFYSVAICAISAVLEGVLAGRGVKARFAELRLPRHSPPLRVWFVIGGVFYAVCFIVLYRLFGTPSSRLRDSVLALLVGIMGVNALWNYVFFRMRDLFLGFLVFLPYDLMAIALFVLLLKQDPVAAAILLPYIAYLGYATAWGYALWKLNRLPAPAG